MNPKRTSLLFLFAILISILTYTPMYCDALRVSNYLVSSSVKNGTTFDHLFFLSDVNAPAPYYLSVTVEGTNIKTDTSRILIEPTETKQLSVSIKAPACGRILLSPDAESSNVQITTSMAIPIKVNMDCELQESRTIPYSTENELQERTTIPYSTTNELQETTTIPYSTKNINLNQEEKDYIANILTYVDTHWIYICLVLCIGLIGYLYGRLKNR